MSTDQTPQKGIPLTQEMRDIFLFRLDLLERNLRPCNSAAEAHEVGNMRNVIQYIRHLLECDDSTDDCVKQSLERLEKQQVEFFKKKYGHWNI